MLIGVLYIIAQTIGAALAGALLRGVFGLERSVKYGQCRIMNRQAMKN
jgi:hypothetical protein